jgi:hypothetical protein
VIRLSRTERFALWRLAAPGGRLMLLDGNQITPLAANPITARVRIPAGAGGRKVLLAEPADGGWHARLDGDSLRAEQADGWAQSWDVPPAGGQFTLTRGMLTRHIWLGVQAAALLVVIALALPGGRAEEGGPEPWAVRTRRRGAAGPEPDADDEPDPAGGDESESAVRVAGTAPGPAPGPASDPVPAQRTGSALERAPAGEPAVAAPEPDPGQGQRRRGRGARRRPARGVRILRGLRRPARRRPDDEAAAAHAAAPGTDGAADAADQGPWVAALGRRKARER